jgi:WhiB family redox-sensing transcriptional regulator
MPGRDVAALPTEVLIHRTGIAGQCSDSNSDRWFPENEPGPAATAAELDAYADFAREACAGCPVIMECRERALRVEARPGVRSHGVSGGLAPHERRALIRARRENLAVAS